MGQVNSVTDGKGGGAAASSWPSHSSAIPVEVQTLSAAFKAYKKDGEKFRGQPRISTEVFQSNLAREAASNYLPPMPSEPTKESQGGDSQPALGPKKPSNEYLMNDLIRDEDVIAKIYEHVKSKMRSTSVEFENFLQESNFQENKEQHQSPEQLMINKAISEVHQDLQTGFHTAASHSEMLKGCDSASTTEYDKYFLISKESQNESRIFSREVMSKQLYILYSIYLQRQKLNDEEQQDFFDYVNKFLNLPKEESPGAKGKEKDQADGAEGHALQYSMPPLSVGEARTQVSLDVGLKFSINLLKELGQVNKGLLTSSLQCLLDSLKQYRPGALYCATDRMSYQMDQNLNIARDFLLEEINEVASGSSPLTPEYIKYAEIAVKIIMMLGIVRSNVEDYLIILTVIQKLKDVDLSDEIQLISAYYGFEQKPTHELVANPSDEVSAGGLDADLKNFKIGKQNLLTSISIQMLMSSGPLLEIRGTCGDKMIADDEYFYIYKNQSVKGYNPGLYKLSSAQSEQNSQGGAVRLTGRMLQSNTSEVMAERSEQNLDSHMFLLHGKIYLKYKELQPAVEKAKAEDSSQKDKKSMSSELAKLMAIDANTLEPVRDFAQANGLSCPSLDNVQSWTEWRESKNQDVNYNNMPIITDGSHLYVFGRQRKKQATEASGAEHKYIIIINIYKVDGSENQDLPSFKYLRQITLLKSQFDAFSKDQNSETFIGKTAQWATNGQVLLCFSKKNKLFCFDLNTGLKICKALFWTAGDTYANSMLYFNYMSGLFVRMLTRDHSSEINRYWIFTYSNFKIRNQEFSIKKELSDIRAKVYSRSQQEPIPCQENQNIIKNLMKKSKKAQRKEKPQASERIPSQLQRCLILDQLNHFTKENFDIYFEEIRNKSTASNQVINDILQLFKFQNCTYLTESVFILLADNLNDLKHVISASPQQTGSKETIADQYSLLYLFNLVNANFRALSHCQIKLSFLLDDELAQLSEAEQQTAVQDISKVQEEFWNDGQVEKGYRYFMLAYESTIVAVVEKGQHIEHLAGIENSETREELTQLWNEIHEVCKEIIDGSVSLLHQDPSSMVEILLNGLSKPKAEISLQNICVQISYLNLKDNLKKVIDHPKLSILTEKISELFNDQMSARLNQSGSVQSGVSKLVEQTTKSFILNYTQLVLQMYCETQESLISKQKKMQSQQIALGNEEKKEDQAVSSLDIPKAEVEIDLANKYQRQLVEVTELNFSYLEKNLAQIVEAMTAKAEHDSEIEQRTSEIAKLNFFADILTNKNAFYENCFVFTNTFALLKLDSFIQDHLMAKFVERLMTIIKKCSIFQSLQVKAATKETGEPLLFKHAAPAFMVAIDKLYRQISWLLGQTAFRMIQVKKQSGPNSDKEQPNSKGKLTDQQKKNLVNIQESNLLSGGIETRHLTSVLSKERQKLLKTYLMIVDDKFLTEYFDPAQEQENQEEDQNASPTSDDRILQAVIQEGKDAMTDCLLRCLQRSFEQQLPRITYARFAGQNGLRMARSAFALLIKFSDMLEDFVSLVDQAQFYNEVESQDTENVDPIIAFLKDLPQWPMICKKWEQAARMRPWISEEKGQLSIKYEKEVRDELLKKRKSEAKKAEEDQIDSSADRRAKQEEKSQEETKEKKQPSSDEQRLTPDDEAFIQDEAFNRLEKDLAEIFMKIQKKSEFLIKLQIPLQFLNKQNYQPDIDSPLKSQESREKSEEPQKQSVNSSVQSCVSCVLSLLQAPVEFGKIQEQVELIYQNACKRVTGLKIIADLVNLDAPQYILEDSLNWFCSALRGNKNKITHYMDDIKGEGTYLENKTRMYFFQILHQIVKRLKESTNKAQIKYFLKNTLEWKFMGRDHKNLLELGIFQVLHKGNGEKSNLIKRSWGRHLLVGKRFQPDEQSVSKDVIEYFEHLLISIIARIVDATAQDSEPTQKKKNQLSLQKAKSVINEDVSETLLGQGFDIIFKEFNRYVKIMSKLFKGIDWATYVKSRTNEDYQKLLSDELQGLINVMDDENEKEQVEIAKVEVESKEENNEEQLKKEAEAKQKLRIAQQLSQIGSIYHESYLKRLMRILEIFTNVQSSKAIENKESQDSSTPSLGQYHLNLLVKLTSSSYLATLLNLLLLCSPSVAHTILQIIQQLIRVQEIPHSVFDQAVEQIVAQTSSPQTEALRIYNDVSTNIAQFKSPFLRFLYQYVYSIQSKMWSKSCLESEGSYAISCEIIKTLRFIYEENYEADAPNNIWRVEIDAAISKLFKSNNFGQYKKNFPIELEIVMSLIRGCEYLGMTPYASAVVIDNKADVDIKPEGAQKVNGMQGKQRKYVQVIGFVHKKWLQRTLDWGEEEKRVFPVMRDSAQKVLVMQYDPNNLAECQLQIVEPQNLSLKYDLNILNQKANTSAKSKKLGDLNQIPAQPAKDASKSKEFSISTEILNTILRESKILRSSGEESGNDQDINSLSQKTTVMKLIHYQLENNTEDFLKILKSSEYYKELLRYVCRESSSSDHESTGSSNQITLVDWLEQRCAAIRLHACENQTSLIKHQEVKMSLVKDKLYVQTQNKESCDKNDFYMTAIQLISAINYQSFEEKKEFRLVLGDEIMLENQSEDEKKQQSKDLDASQVTETNDVALVRPEHLKAMNSKGFEILNQCKSLITFGVDFNDIVGIMVEKKRVNKDRYASLASKAIFLVQEAEFETISQILNDKSQGKANDNKSKPAENVFGATPFEESLVEELIKHGGFSRVVAEKIIGKEGSLEKKTLHFSQILKQIKDGLIDVKELEEQRQAEIQKQQKNSDSNKKSQRRKKSKIEQRQTFDRPEEKCEVMRELKHNFLSYANRNEGEHEVSIEEFNDRHAYFAKVNSFTDKEGLPQEYERIVKRLFNMYCRQIFWSLIQNDDIEKIFELILHQPKEDGEQILSSSRGNDDEILNSMRSFTVFMKVIGNECFITNNKKYIASFKQFLNKVVQTCCKSESKYKSLLHILVSEAIIDSYHDHFGELSGEHSEFKKHMFEYFQSESKAENLVNPIVLTEIVELIIQHDVGLIFDNLVAIVSLLAAVSMYFASGNDLKNKFMEQILRILEITRKEALKPEPKVTLEQISMLVNLKILMIYFSEFESYNEYNMEEAQYAKRVLKDDQSKELNGINRKQVESQVYLYRGQVHQKYIECHSRIKDATRLMLEVAYKLRELAEIKDVDVNYAFQNNMMSYFDLYKRVLDQLKEEGGEQSSLNKYLTFYESLEDSKKIYSHDVAIKNPEEGCDIQTLQVDFGGNNVDQKQLVEKVLVRLDDAETQFSSQGATILISQDKDAQDLIMLYNKSLFTRDQTLHNVYSKGKPFYVHYPVYPSLNYKLSVTSDEPKFEIMETQLFDQFDDFTNNDFGTFYLGGNFKKLHHKHGDTTKPYKNHLDLQKVNFGKNLMIFLLKSGQVYGIGMNKRKHFIDQDQRKHFDHEQLIPFYDTKDKVESIETYKRATLAVTRKGRIYAVGDKLKKLLKIKDERFGFYQLPLNEQQLQEEVADGEKPKEDQNEEEKKGEEDLKETKEENETLKAKKAWISRCKGQNNYVIYCLFENTEVNELELHSIGKNQGGGLLGLGENTQEALCFKKMDFKLASGDDKATAQDIKITSVEGVDIRCGRNHTIISLNGYESVFVLGCYDKGSQSHEEIAFEPKPLKLCEQYKIQKIGTEQQKTVIVAQKKDSEKVQVLIGQFAPLAKEDSFKTVQFDVDLSSKSPNKVTQIYVLGSSAYVSTSGSFEVDPYLDADLSKDQKEFQKGFKAQGLKQSFQTMSQEKSNRAANSGIALKLTPDYGFFENEDFIKHNQADWDKFEKALIEYKEVLAEEPESIPEFEKMIKDYMHNRLKDDNFTEIHAYWKSIKEKNDLDESRGLKSKNNEKINESISVECKKYNLGLLSTYHCYIWGSLSYINQSVPSSNIANLSLLSTFMKNNENLPWITLNKLLKQLLSNMPTDGENIAIHVNRKKAQEFASSGKVDTKGDHTIFAQVQKKLEANRHKGLKINAADKKAWFVKFIGEYAVDDGGLFRESLSELCAELRSPVLPLLLMSKNQQANAGSERDMWVLNPGATTETQLKMIEFLGALMGMSFRSGILLDVNLSRFIWKQVAGRQLTKEDLPFVDELFVKDLDNVLAKSKTLSDEEFDKEFGETHTMSTLLSNDQVVDLVKNGREIQLKKHSAQEFHDKAIEARLSESKMQVQSLIAGIDKTFDKKFLRLVSWKYLEYKVVGMNEISLDRLKEISAYRNCSDTHEVIKRFWQVLQSFSNEERISYLRFVWGRTRLPLKEEEVIENHTIQLDETADSTRLPIGRTCFFRLELPPYESTQLLRSKLLYSINHCKAIDADYDRAGSPNEEEVIDAAEVVAAAAEEEDSDEHRVNLFGEHGDEYSSSGMGGGGGEEEEEE